MHLEFTRHWCTSNELLICFTFYEYLAKVTSKFHSNIGNAFSFSFNKKIQNMFASGWNIEITIKMIEIFFLNSIQLFEQNTNPHHSKHVIGKWNYLECTEREWSYSLGINKCKNEFSIPNSWCINKMAAHTQKIHKSHKNPKKKKKILQITQEYLHSNSLQVEHFAGEVLCSVSNSIQKNDNRK